MALKINQSKPKMQINLYLLTSAGGASQAVLSNCPAHAVYDGTNITFDFAGEEIIVGPIKDINYFLENVSKGEAGSIKLCQSICEQLETHLKDSGLANSFEQTTPQAQMPAYEGNTTVNGLQPRHKSPAEISATDHPALALYDYVPGTSETNYRAIGRTMCFLFSVKLSNEKSGSIRVEALPEYDIDSTGKERLDALGFSIKNGVNSAGKHCQYATLHGGLGPDDMANMFDLIGALLARFNMRLPVGVTLEDLQP